MSICALLAKAMYFMFIRIKLQLTLTNLLKMDPSVFMRSPNKVLSLMA